MKRYLQILLAVFLALPLWSAKAQATNELAAQLQRGLLAEEVHRDFGTALKAYQSAVAAYDTNRQAAATAVFRLGEVYRKLGKTNEARLQYERILFEFADQTALVGAARSQLQIDFGKGALPAFAVTNGPGDDVQQKLLRNELKMREAQLASLRKIKPDELPLALNQYQYDDVLNGLLKTKNELMMQRAIRLKEFSREHPEIVKMEATVKENEKLIADHVRIVMGQMEERVRLLGEQVNGGVITSRTIPTRPLKVTSGGETAFQEQLRRLTENAASPPSAPVQAAEQQEIVRLQAMLKNSPDLINSINGQNGWAPLHEAISKGQGSVVEFLLKNGADANLKANTTEWTPLHLTAYYGHKAIAELLLKHGADKEAVAEDGKTPLILAASRGFRGVVGELLGAGAKVDVQEKSGYTALHHAAALGNYELTEQLLKEKANPNLRTIDKDWGTKRNENSWTPLHVAAKSGVVLVVRSLLTAGAKVDALDANGVTPLVIALANNRTAALQALLDGKADPNLKNSSESTPLILVKETTMVEAVERLLAAGAAVNVTNKHGVTPLLSAISARNSAVTRLLLKHKANPGVGNAYVGTPLAVAVNAKDVELVRSLLQAGADPNVAFSGSLWTPVRGAVVLKQLEMARLLIEYKADLTVTNRQGHTLLHYAVANMDKPMVELLLQAKLDIDVISGEGETPLMMAKWGQLRDLDKDESIPRAQVTPVVINTPSQPIRSGRPVGVPPGPNANELKQGFQEIAELLIRHGADEYVARRRHISISRRASGREDILFSKDSAGRNRYSLFELLGCCYGGSGLVASYWFPDFSRISISRIEGKQEKIMTLNLAQALETGDVSKDVWLQWGDVVEVPEADHALSARWEGLEATALSTLKKATGRRVELLVKGKSQDLHLGYMFIKGYAAGSHKVYEREKAEGGKPAVDMFMPRMSLSSTVFYSKALLASSDTKRVKVTRKVPGTGQSVSMVYDIGAVQNSTDDLWLRDGDVIEVPEKE